MRTNTPAAALAAVSGRAAAVTGPRLEITPSAAQYEQLCRDLATLAEERFAEAERLMARCARGPMRPARIMLAMYRRLLTRLQRNDWQNITQRVGLPKAEKLWIALRSCF